MHDALSDLSGIDTGTEASTDVDESDGAGEVPRRPKLVTPDAFTEAAAAAQHRPDSSNSNVTSVTSVSSLLNQSQRSEDDFLNSSSSSRLSNSTLKSSVEEGTPRVPCVDESFVMTPTSLPLPLPQTPPSHSAPDPSFVPIPTFGSSLETKHEGELQAGSPAPVAAQKAAEGSPVGEADVILEDDAKEDEDLPEAQKAGAEAQDEDSCAGAGLLIDLTFKEPVQETHAVLPLECGEGSATGRESPESANAIPVTATPCVIREADRAWANPE